MSVFKIRPTRPIDPIVSDLDALIQKPITFRLHGKVHEIRPVTTAVFLEIAERMNMLQEFSRSPRPSVTNDEIIEMYFKLFSAVCDTIKKHDIEEMSQAQLGALLSLVLEHIQGKTQVESAQKKTLPSESN